MLSHGKNNGIDTLYSPILQNERSLRHTIQENRGKAAQDDDPRRPAMHRNVNDDMTA